MTNAWGYAAQHAKAKLEPYTFSRRDPSPNDIVIEIQFCGVCHSDIHQLRDEWGGSIFPMVPGHEIVGHVVAVGGQVKNFKVGDRAGVGVLVDSCRHCPSCESGEEQYCEIHPVYTYNCLDLEGQPTYGGYSNTIVVDQAYALRIPDSLNLAATAPLLCAGITTYSPLRHWKIGKGHKVGIVGLGGLGHMGLKFAHSFGAEVTLFTTSPDKKEDAIRLGADSVILSKDPDAMAAQVNSFDFILDTVSAPHDLDKFLNLLRLDGTMTLVGLPEIPPTIQTSALVFKRRSLAGSVIGSIAETQEMLDYCGEHGIVSDIEIIPIQQVNEAYERVIKSEVKYRFVIDMESLPKP